MKNSVPYLRIFSLTALYLKRSEVKLLTGTMRSDPSYDSCYVDFIIKNTRDMIALTYLFQISVLLYTTIFTSNLLYIITISSIAAFISIKLRLKIETYFIRRIIMIEVYTHRIFEELF